jgi:hypothetical protein
LTHWTAPAVEVYTLGISDAMFKTISSVVIPFAVAFLLNRAYRTWDHQELRATLWLGAICLVLIVVGVAIALDTRANEKDDIRRADFLIMERIGPVSEPWKGFDFGAGFTPAFRVSFFNNGPDPIKDAKVNVNMLLAQEPLKDSLIIDAAKDEQLLSIAPFERQFLERIYPRKLTPEDTIPLNQEPPTFKFYVYGSFRYGTHQDRFFCRVFNPMLGKENGRPYLLPDNIFEPCSTDLIRKA